MNDRDREEIVYGTDTHWQEELAILTPIAIIALAEIAGLVWWLLR